ncbi:hypothetical protein F7725_019829 [Dissostichus mawsoni]|uniref:Uncharacterized protein n=1 Tax=Dissostichus mawsoni TaxID=36200 RepID=A0A7J5YL65_DISMA|nr:hypothetical protein F7725_019829 [Dissostichus mawsoni]
MNASFIYVLKSLEKTAPWIPARSKVKPAVSEQSKESTSGEKPTLRRSIGMETFPNILLFMPDAALSDSHSLDGIEACPHEILKDLRFVHFSRFARGHGSESSPVLTGVGKLQLTPWRKRISI